MIRMIGSTNSIDAGICDRFHAESTLGSKQFVEVLLAIGFAIHFYEVSIWEGPATLGTYEVLSVPLFVHSIHYCSYNHLPTSYKLSLSHDFIIVILFLILKEIKEDKKKFEDKIPAHGGPLKVRTCPLGACVAGTIPIYLKLLLC